ncbi:hypothetical protein [Alcanivorax sp. 24]|nr:hypothetical protein [Alcanivorax sp. 24]
MPNSTATGFAAAQAAKKEEAAKDGWRELTRPAEKSDAKDDGTISI